ncbi:dermonecrotic toxin domain-containing protein [Pseudomonas sp. NPDC089422]|uniref:dermonecrotic toxin domain-containing protein n=1 Tax=Pseudomonas sp. NPDC089422 TaxID=3364466 RepID=UPI00382ED7A5
MALTEQQQQDQVALKRIATALNVACPDMVQMAREAALALLARHRLDTLEPDQVYLHRFHEAVSSPRTFTGWQHFTPPFESMTLVQLVMYRFTAAEQDASDLLSTYSGFYAKGPGEAIYDEHNEIRLLPKDALDYFWEIDFRSRFELRASEFCAKHGDDLRTMAKATFLAEALQICKHAGNSALATRVQQAAKALAGEHDGAVTLQYLRQSTLPAHGVSVYAFSIGERISSDILRIVFADGQQLLYVPSQLQAFHLFVSDRELHAWVLANTLEPLQKARLMSHFPLAEHQPSAAHKTVDFFSHYAAIGLGGLFEIMRRQWNAAEIGGVDKPDTPLHIDAFSHLSQAAQQRMTDDAQFALHSNWDIRKDMLRGYLRAGLKVFGPLTVLASPVALACAGAGAALITLDIDEAYNGHNSAERQAAVENALFDIIDTLQFGLAAVSGAGAVTPEAGDVVPPMETPVEPVPPAELEPATQEEIDIWVPKAFQPGELNDPLAALQSNDIVTSTPGSATLEGIHTQDGKFYVMVADLTYQVRYVGELKTWVIVDPENPFAFRQSVPIIRDADGSWKPQPTLGLKGGTPRFLLKAWGRLQPRPALAPLGLELYTLTEDERLQLKPFALENENPSGLMQYSDTPLTRPYHRALGQMTRDVNAFYDQVQLPIRPALPAFAPSANARQIIASLYEENQGLVLGESHNEECARQFLTQNMRQLKRRGVNVLYSEHFMIDYQQADMDVFNRTGVLPAELKTYVEAWDAEAQLRETTRTIRYTLKRVLYEAYAQNIRVQGIDTMVGYRMGWEMGPPFNAARQRMMNYTAQRIMTADQAQRGPSKWVALMGNTHANTFERVPGVSELQGCIGLRVVGVPRPSRLSIGVDPGLEIDEEFVQSDLLLSVPSGRA